MIMKKMVYDNKGQALVMLLIYMVITISIVSAAVVAVIVNSISGSKQVSSQNVYVLAEGGIENALLRLIRNPEYTGEILEFNEGTATVDVTGTEPKTILSVGKIGNFVRSIEVSVSYIDNELRILSWDEL